MSPSQLSPELWSLVLSFCMNSEQLDERRQYGSLLAKTSKQSTLAKALRVNSVFFLAAAPHLYRSPVTDNLEAFLLGADRSIFQDVEDDRSLIRHGNTKLPLLRHVKRLLLEPAYTQLASKQGGEDPDWEADLEKGLNQLRSLDRATTMITRMSAHRAMMPRVEAIGTGRADHQGVWNDWRAPNWLLAQPWTYAASLMNAFNPRYWCEHKQSLYLEFPSPTQPLHYLDGFLPALITHHTDLDTKKYVRFVWGTVNRVYIHRDQSYPEARESFTPEDVIDWLETSITHSRPPWTKSSWAMTKRICADTKIEVYGAGGNVGGSWTPTSREVPMDNVLAVGLVEAVTDAYEDSLKQGEVDEREIDFREMISLNQGEEMVSCPCCGLGWEVPRD